MIFNIIHFFLSNVVSRTGLHNLSGLDQFDKLVSLAHFPVSKKRTTAHLRTPFHCFRITSRALTVSLLLPDSEKFSMVVWSPYYSFVFYPYVLINLSSVLSTCPRLSLLSLFIILSLSCSLYQRPLYDHAMRGNILEKHFDIFGQILFANQFIFLID